MWEEGVSPGWTLAVIKTAYLLIDIEEVSFLMVLRFNSIFYLEYFSFSSFEVMISRWIFLPSTDCAIISLLKSAILLYVNRRGRFNAVNKPITLFWIFRFRRWPAKDDSTFTSFGDEEVKSQLKHFVVGSPRDFSAQSAPSPPSFSEH